MRFGCNAYVTARRLCAYGNLKVRGLRVVNDVWNPDETPVIYTALGHAEFQQFVESFVLIR
ncbi:MAG: hypothetical protein ABSF35_06960 [Polyangia bacterium]|jgi:hypothetical protein